MEQIKLHDIDHDLEDIDLSKEYPIDNQDAVYFNEHSANKKTTSSRNDVNDDDFDDEEDNFDDESLLDRDIRTSLDPYDMVNSLLYSKQSTGDKDKTKQQKEIDKLIKKQLKRVEEEWAKLSGKKDKKDKKKKDKDKNKKKDKKDKDKKKDKKSKKDKEAKKLEKSLKKESKKSTKKD